MSKKTGFMLPDFNSFAKEHVDYVESNKVNSEVADVSEKKPWLDLMDFKTTQKDIPIPTMELIRCKNVDFRVFAIILIMSNVDNFTIAGSNVRYTSLHKLDRNLDTMSEVLNLSKSEIRKEIKKLLENNSQECSLITREYNGRIVNCIQTQYRAGGFVLVPVDILQEYLLKVSSTALKMFLNLLWLCRNKGSRGYIETLVYQDTLLNNRGYKPASRAIITKAAKELEQAGLISIRRCYDCETIVKDGEIGVSTPKKQCFYSILI